MCRKYRPFLAHLQNIVLKHFLSDYYLRDDQTTSLFDMLDYKTAF